jgi:N-methylhydantoinase A
MSLRVGIDIGGAFTDLYATDTETKKVEWTKVESTPPEFEKGVLEGIDTLEEQGVYIKNADRILHGQTVVINTIITRTGANVGFITTKNYDIMDIQRANRRDIFNFRYKKPTPLISRYMSEWIDERIDQDGSIHKPLKGKEVASATKALIDKGAESFCIGFINSYQNPQHEKEAKEIVEKVCKDGGVLEPFITLSSDITREWREYERFSSAVLNAYTQPVFVRYLEKLERALRNKGFGGTFYIALASGGLSTSDYAKLFPIRTVEGGPISGIMGGIYLGKMLKEENLIVIDGGSTTIKAGLAKKLSPEVSTEYWVEKDEYHEGYPIKIPTVNISEIGNGGTSIIWIDETGNIQVGPKATGARSGPACYGMGGKEPTLTDAYVVTGYLNPEYLLGGKLRILKGLAAKAIGKVAKQLKVDLKDAAYEAIRVANDNSSHLIRLISIRRGFDPRDFTLIAHGGSGPMLAPFISKELGIPRIVVPTIPSGVFNSWGMTNYDVRHELLRTNVMGLKEIPETINKVNRLFKEIEEDINATFSKEGIDPNEIKLEKFIDLKYEGQAYTLKIRVSNGKLKIQNIKKIRNDFHNAHFREYGFKLDSPIEVVNFHVVGVYKTKPLRIEKRLIYGTLKDAFLEERNIYNGNEISVPIYKKEKLPTGIALEGPCIIEGDTATIIVNEKTKGKRDLYGNLIMIQ